MTYSIVACDPRTGELGVAVQSHYFSVGRVVPWAEAGVGAVATQSIVEIGYGPLGLERMRQGEDAATALAALVAADEMAAVRQVAMVDAAGNPSSHTGEACVACAGHMQGEGVSVQANMMERPTVWRAMLSAYEKSDGGPLARRLLAALDAAEGEGGDIRGRQSAALLVVSHRRSDTPWQERLVELRVDDHAEPLQELRRLLDVHDAHGRMSALFESPLLFGGDVPDAADLEHWHGELSAARQVLDGNGEPGFWEAMLLAKAGRVEQAQDTLRAVYASNPRWAEFIERLVPLGVLPADDALIARLRERR